jgi:RNA recognition motif. (a.k.a. RRM, RBD, or RNP domain)
MRHLRQVLGELRNPSRAGQRGFLIMSRAGKGGRGHGSRQKPWRPDRGCYRCRAFFLLISEILFVNIYVGNLPFSATESELRELFERHGAVASVALPVDRETGRVRGFGFVESIAALNGEELGGRDLRVNEGRPRS